MASCSAFFLFNVYAGVYARAHARVHESLMALSYSDARSTKQLLTAHRYKESYPMAWKIDSSHSRVAFSVRHMMISNVHGQFQNVSGTVEFDEAQPTRSTVDVQIDAASIDTHDEKRDAHLRSPDFFNVEKYPTLAFRSTSVERAGNGLRVAGDLTIAGVTKPVILEVEDEGRARDPWGNEKAAFHATTKIKRTDFGLTWNVALEAGGVLVGDDIKISIDAQLARG